VKKALRFSLRRSIPVAIGYFPLGVAWGILMQQMGYGAPWCLLVSSTVFGGSIQYLMLEFFAAGAALSTVAVTVLLLGSRQIFYGLTFLEKFRSYGKWQWLLSFLLVDEAYSLFCGFDPKDEDIGKSTYLITGLLGWFYWTAFTVLGALAGRLITFDTTGIDFAMTALFVVILIERLQSGPSCLPAVIAAASSVGCLALIGPDGFLLPSLLLTVAGLVLARPVLGPLLAQKEAS